MSTHEGDEVDFASVGIFREKTPHAHAPGLYRYEPYRSGSHYDLQEELRHGRQVRCRIAAPDGSVVHFLVHGCPEYGVLDISFPND